MEFLKRLKAKTNKGNTVCQDVRPDSSPKVPWQYHVLLEQSGSGMAGMETAVQPDCCAIQTAKAC